MVLSGLEIKNRIGNDIIITPFNEKRLNPNSYNLRLDNKLLVYKNDILDMKKDNPVDVITIPETGFTMQPGELYLGKTMEYTETHNNIVPGLEGRSSIGRLGLYIHVTAGFGDVGFKGYWTLELHCIKPIKIYAGTEICQIYYHEVKGNIIPYRSLKYQNNRDVQSSMLWKDFINE